MRLVMHSSFLSKIWSYYINMGTLRGTLWRTSMQSNGVSISKQIRTSRDRCKKLMVVWVLDIFQLRSQALFPHAQYIRHKHKCVISIRENMRDNLGPNPIYVKRCINYWILFSCMFELFSSVQFKTKLRSKSDFNRNISLNYVAHF